MLDPKAIVENRCTTCHARELIENQRLSLTQWTAVLKKMETFGVHLENDEKESLLSYFKDLSPKKAQADSQAIDYEEENRKYQRMTVLLKGNQNRGEKAFKENCASCHGQKGEGKIGPRLMGRWITPDLFLSTVLYGKKIMPPFHDVLKEQEIADIRSFLGDDRTVN